jgi:hypothetical protein
MMSDAALPVAPAGIWVQLLVGEEKQGESFEIKLMLEDQFGSLFYGACSGGQNE